MNLTGECDGAGVHLDLGEAIATPLHFINEEFRMYLLK